MSKGLQPLVEFAAAFFRISRSSRRSRFSRRRRTSSLRSSLVKPSLRRPLSRASCLTQWRSDSAETPRSLAAALMLRPPSRTRRTASARNSGGYSGVNFRAMADLLVGLAVPSVRVSTKPGQLQSSWPSAVQLAADLSHVTPLRRIASARPMT